MPQYLFPWIQKTIMPFLDIMQTSCHTNDCFMDQSLQNTMLSSAQFYKYSQWKPLSSGMCRRDITQTGAKPLDTPKVSRFPLCQVSLASLCIFYQTKRWHIPQASNWRRHGSQHVEYITLSLPDTSFPECTPRWKHSCWLVSEVLFLFMLHCLDIDTIIKNYFRFVFGFLAFCRVTLLIVRTSVEAWCIGGMTVTVEYTRVGTLIVATTYLQLIQNRYMFRSFTVLQCSHQHCVQPVASDVEVVGYL